jgi:hypothetical protein
VAEKGEGGVKQARSRSGVMYTSARENPWFRTPRRERDRFIHALLTLGVPRRTIAETFGMTTEGVRLAARRAVA